MDPSIFRYIWRYSRSSQISVLLLVLASLPFYFLMLDLPRNIVNGPIQGHGFETSGALATFLRLQIIPPGFMENLTGSGPFVIFEGFQLPREGILLALSFSLLVLVAVNGVFKLQINTLKGRMGERMLRRLRYQLFDRVLRFPTAHVRKVRQAEVASMIKDEVEPLGGFIGDAFVQPAFLGGQAITALIFIMIQSFWLGLVAGAIIMVQGFIIPKMRRVILDLGRQRQLAARELAGKVGEVVEGALEVHAHDTSHYERALITSRLGEIFLLRFEIYRRKFLVKFLNNTLAQITPFIFYSVGGYFAIRGRMDIGQLVAALVAYKELPTPVKELIDWDQQRLDVQIKYESIINQFNPEGLLHPALQNPDPLEDTPLTGPLTASRLSLENDMGIKLLDQLSFSFDVRAHVAVTGPVGGGQEYLGLVLARLVFPTSGKLTVGGRDMAQLPEAVTGRRISYAGAESILFTRSVRENLIYGLMHRPLTPPVIDDGANPRQEALALAETRRAGNSVFDLRSDWIDYKAAGAEGPYDIDNQIAAVLDVVELREDVYQLGLRDSIDPEENAPLARNILQARKVLHEMVRDEGIASLVDPFDPALYNHNASVGENLLFGTAVGAAFATANLITNDYFLEVLDYAGLTAEMTRIGLAIAGTMVELFADLAPGHPFFDQFSFISSEDLPLFQEIVTRAKDAPEQLLDADRKLLLGLPLDYIEARHRLGLIDSAMEKKILSARRVFARDLPEHYRGAIEFYEPDQYNSAASLLDNILFGRVVHGQAEAQARINALISDVVDQLNIRWEIFKIGLNFNVGGRGRTLALAQRQKLMLARALLKRPDLLIVSDVIAQLDGRSQKQILENVKRFSEGKGLIWIGGLPVSGRDFDHVLVMGDGKIAGQDRKGNLPDAGGQFPQLLAAG